MKYFFLLMLLTVITFFSCEKPSQVENNIPECIEAKIKQIAEDPVRNPRGAVWQYRYKGQIVYFIPQYCCDMFSELYDSNCELICHPDGGITGAGDGQCADFFSERTNEKLIWKDSRK
ncbi:MAG: DUF6970 domain-containing protein [Niabella sp.]